MKTLTLVIPIREKDEKLVEWFVRTVRKGASSLVAKRGDDVIITVNPKSARYFMYGLRQFKKDYANWSNLRDGRLTACRNR